MKYCFIILLYLSIYIHSKKINLLDTIQDISKTGKTNAIIHFINCGLADSILFQQNGRFV